jgi:hypothetical protein
MELEMRMTTKKLLLVLVVGVLGSLGLIALGSAAGNRENPAPVTFAPVGPTHPAVAPATALGEAVRQLGGKFVASARLGNPPPNTRDKALPWLYATVRVPGMAQGLDIEPMWEADLLEGAVVERSGTSTDVWDDFGGSTFDALLPDGTTVSDASGGLGDVARNQEFSKVSPVQARNDITEAARAAGLDVEAIRFLRPLGLAPAVIVSAADVNSTVTNFVSIAKRLFGDPPIYEGYYLELRTTEGVPVVRSSASFRTGAGRFWVDARWKDVIGITSLGRPPSSTVPVGGKN